MKLKKSKRREVVETDCKSKTDMATRVIKESEREERGR